VNIGAVFALCTSLLGAMFPLPRVLYAMANDGIIFKFLAIIHPRTMTPVLGTIISGLLTGQSALLSFIFKSPCKHVTNIFNCYSALLKLSSCQIVFYFPNYFQPSILLIYLFITMSNLYDFKILILIYHIYI
jgi:amino acid transporter